MPIKIYKYKIKVKYGVGKKKPASVLPKKKDYPPISKNKNDINLPLYCPPNNLWTVPFSEELACYDMH